MCRDVKKKEASDVKATWLAQLTGGIGGGEETLEGEKEPWRGNGSFFSSLGLPEGLGVSHPLRTHLTPPSPQRGGRIVPSCSETPKAQPSPPDYFDLIFSYRLLGTSTIPAFAIKSTDSVYHVYHVYPCVPCVPLSTNEYHAYHVYCVYYVYYVCYVPCVCSKLSVAISCPPCRASILAVESARPITPFDSPEFSFLEGPLASSAL